MCVPLLGSSEHEHFQEVAWEVLSMPFSPFRIAVFSVSVFYDERIVVVAEQRPDASEEDSFQWMSRVLQVRAKQFCWVRCGSLQPGGTGICQTEPGICRHTFSGSSKKPGH